MKNEYTERLDKIQRDVDWIIQYLLKRDEPVQPPPYTAPTSTTRCAKCGMSFEGITGYYCSDPRCPTFPRTTL